jgi:hypothetical protein
VREIATPIPPVVIQIFAVATVVSAVCAKIALVATFVPAVAAKITAILPRLAVPAVGAIAPQILAVRAAIAVVGPNVASIARDIAAVAAQIAPVGANVACIVADFSRSLGPHGRLRARDRRSTGGQRYCDAECDESVAKHCEILRRSVACDGTVAPFKEVDERTKRALTTPNV